MKSSDHASQYPPQARARLPELLAPAGDWDCARAAVENGADAIYFGLDRFNARMRARNFSASDLPELMSWLHARGVRGYVTLNTLVFTDELPEAEATLRTVIRCGADAAIVQDIGLCRLIRRLSPDFPIHASTQMTVTSAGGVALVRELGCERVVLARENSISEIARIRAALEAESCVSPLEVFVHGALCVAYSGQCLTSEALGGRSANRGECAQACRLPYELIADGQTIDLADRRYLLSPQDLAGVDLLPDLVRAGVASLKIEGRLKSPEYVASITRIYREALDRLAATEDMARSVDEQEQTPKDAPAPLTRRRDRRYEMEMAFSRGLSSGWLQGNDHQRLVHGRFGKKRGVLLGCVTRVARDRVWLRPEAPIKAGDGVVFDAGRPESHEEGGRIFEVVRHGTTEVSLLFASDAVDLRQVQTGDRVWKTSDPELNRELRRTFEGGSPRFRRPIHAQVHGHAGTPLSLVLRDDQGLVAKAESAMALVPATRRPMDDAVLRAHLGRLGGTGYELATLQNRLEGGVILPFGELHRLRRAAVAGLDAVRARPGRWTLSDALAAAVDPSKVGRTGARQAAEAGIAVLVRTEQQLEAVLTLPVDRIYCDFEDPRRYREAVARARAMGRGEIFVAPPRIFKPGEEWILRQVCSADPDGFLVRNYDHLKCLGGSRRVGDFSLNVANPLSAEYWIEERGLERVTASYDLNADQLEVLLLESPPEWFEITLHQHMPMFHMEHCVFCAFLSKGKDYRDCGRPCDRRQVRLKDRVGATHLVKADAGCRNTVFNSRAQTGAEYAARLLAAGARSFRLEFLDETPDDVRRLVGQYGRLLRAEISGEALWRDFRLINQLGVTRGQLGQVRRQRPGTPSCAPAA
jgi:putative protease